MTKSKSNFRNNKLFLLLFVFALSMSFLSFYLFIKLKDQKPIIVSNQILIVDKGTQQLKVFDAVHGVIEKFPISSGQNPGNKIKSGDLKTPEGIFPIIGIEESSEWTYDFGDGNGQTPGAYGPFFFRLKVDEENIFNNISTKFDFSSSQKFSGIGIHGTNQNSSIGKRSSHGCVRLKNEDLIKLKKYIQSGTLVVIIPGKLDLTENDKLILHRKIKNN